MAFPTTEENIRRAEEALAIAFPPALRARLLRDNGGEVDADDDVWQLFPVQDTTDRKRLSRTANHIVRETAEARKSPGFPSTAVAIASNGGGDYLILERTEVDGGTLATEILVWYHEETSPMPVDVEW